METTYISSAALRNQPRLEILRLQSELNDRNIEVATARRADVGLALGSDTSRMIALRNDTALIETLMRSNGTATARLDLIQAGLSDMRENASEVLNTLVALPDGAQSATLLDLEANAALERLADRLNMSDGGSYIFGGTNTDVKPFTRFEDGPQAAIEAAFLAKFGVAVNDPGASAITAADMADFLANEFADLFADPNWGTIWSSASSDNIISRIGVNERVTTGTNANEASLRITAQGMSMVAGLGIGSLSEAARQVIVDEARLVLGQAVADIAAHQSDLAFSQNAISRADDRLLLSRNLLTETIVETEGADPAEAKVYVDLLTTQIEMSYALTGQLSRLSILNFA